MTLTKGDLKRIRTEVERAVAQFGWKKKRFEMIRKFLEKLKDMLACL